VEGGRASEPRPVSVARGGRAAASRARASASSGASTPLLRAVRPSGGPPSGALIAHHDERDSLRGQRRLACVSVWSGRCGGIDRVDAGHIGSDMMHPCGVCVPVA